MQFEFIDTRALTSYLEQLQSFWEKASKNKKFKLEIAVPFVKAEVAMEPPANPTEFEKIVKLLVALRNSGQVAYGFPNSTRDVEKQGFYFTSGRATRFRIPRGRLAPLKSDTDPVVWVMRQNSSSESRQKICGSFIYLLQRPDTAESYQGGWSIYSAMQQLMEELDIIRAEGDPRDQMPYADDRAPEIILEDIGGERQSRRRMLACYRCRSMSDNMYVKIDGEWRRFNDLVAYPLFLATL